jgi:hypothetical protein
VGGENEEMKTKANTREGWVSIVKEAEVIRETQSQGRKEKRVPRNWQSQASIRNIFFSNGSYSPYRALASSSVP